MLIVLLCVSVSASTVVASGSCGTNATWQLLDTGSLSISGSGKVDGSADWQTLNDQITKVSFGSEITEISANAFSGCTGLTSVSFANGSVLTSIGANAFAGCTSLKSNVYLPASLTSIGNRAFYGDSSLSYVRFQNPTAPVLGTEVFAGCSSSLRLYYPYTSTGYTTPTWYGYKTSYYTVTVAGGSCGPSAYWSLKDNGIIEITGSGAVTAVPWNEYKNQIITLAIWVDITSIPDNAFSGCTNLTSVGRSWNASGSSEPALISIGANAFAGCSALKSISASYKNLTTIGVGAFSGCASLRYLDFITDSPLTSIGDEAFAGCTKLYGAYTLPDSLTSIGDRAFYGCKNWGQLISLTDTSITSIGAEAFAGCTSLITAYLPSSLTYLGFSAFAGCTKLAKVRFESPTPPTLGTDVFTGCSASFVVSLSYGCTGYTSPVWNGYDVIYHAYGECGSSATWEYEYVSLHIYGTGSVTSAPWSDFVQDIRYLTITNGITSLGDNLFAGCTNLTNIRFVTTSSTQTDTPALISIGSNTFAGCSSLISVDIYENVISIGDGAFAGCTSLSEVRFRNPTAPTLGTGVFSGCAPDLVLYYEPGSTGYTTPTWNGYRCYPYPVPGDVNADGIVDTADYILLARYIAGWPDAVLTVPAAADYNGDGVVNGKDRYALARYLTEQGNG